MANCDFFMQDLAQASNLISTPSKGTVIAFVQCSIRGNTTSGLTRPTSGLLFFEPQRQITIDKIPRLLSARFSGTVKTDQPFDELGVTISGPAFLAEQDISIDMEVRLFGGQKQSPPRHIPLSPVTCVSSPDGTGQLQASGDAIDPAERFGSYVFDISPVQSTEFGGTIFKPKAG